MPESPQEEYENQFQDWYRNQANRIEKESGFRLDPNPDDPAHHYDYRAAWRAGVQPEGPDWHWPSAFKADTHPNLVVDGVDTKKTHSLNNPQSQEIIMPFDNPQAYASRDLGSSNIPGIGLLQQLLGREGAPTLPPVQQTPTQQLIDAMNAAQGVDPVRHANIRDMIEQRNPDEVARGHGPQAVGVEAAGVTSAEQFRPFAALSDSRQQLLDALDPKK